MSKAVRDMKPWPAGVPLPVGALTFFYHPGEDDEYNIDPARFGAGGSGETAALVAAIAADRALVYEVAKGLTQVAIAGLSLAITTAAGNATTLPTTDHLGLNNLGAGTTYDSATGWLYVVLPASIDPADVLSVHLYRQGATQEQVLAADLIPFGGGLSLPTVDLLDLTTAQMDEVLALTYTDCDALPADSPAWSHPGQWFDVKLNGENRHYYCGRGTYDPTALAGTTGQGPAWHYTVKQA